MNYCDPRDVGFARRVLAEAQRQFLKEDGAPPDACETTDYCIWCGEALPDHKHWSYCSALCAVAAERS